MKFWCAWDRLVADNGAGMPAGELAGAGVAHHGTAVMGRNGGGRPGVGILDSPPAQPASPAGSLPGALPEAPPGLLPGAGHGIIGMRERVILLGGEFSAGPLPGYGFRVSARIPRPASSG